MDAAKSLKQHTTTGAGDLGMRQSMQEVEYSKENECKQCHIYTSSLPDAVIPAVVVGVFEHHSASQKADANCS